MSEQLTKWLIVSGIAALFVVWHLAARSAEKRRRRHLAQLAADFGAAMEIIGDRTLLFLANIDERTFEIRDGYSGGGIGSSTTATRYVTFSTKLRGRSWDLHDVKITLRRTHASEFTEQFKIEQFGMRLPDHWLSDDVQSAITSLSSPFKPEILIEGGNLVYRTMATIRDFSPAFLREHLHKQAALAGALERSR